MNNKKMIKNTFFYVIKVVSSMIIPIITFPYISRVLTPEGMGKYNFANSIMSYFVSLAGLGISSYAIREGSKIRHEREKFNEFANEVFSVNMLSTVCSLATLLTVVLAVPKLQSYRAILLTLSISIPLATVGMEWVFNIYEDYFYITVRSLGFQLISLVLLFTCVHDSQDLLIYCIIIVLSNSGANILNFIRARKYISLKPLFNHNLKKHLPPIFTLFFSAIATQIYVNSDMVMLGFLKTDYVVGIYTAATKIYNIVRSLLGAFVTVITPNMSYLFENDREEYNRQMKDCFKGFFMIVLPISTGIICVGKDIILLLSGEEYASALPALQVLAIALLVSSMGSFFANEILIVSRRDKQILNATIWGGTLNIVGNLLIIPFFSFVGAAFTTVLSELTVLFLQLHYCNKVIKVNVIDSDLIKTLIADILIIFVCKVTNKLVPMLAIRLCVCVCLSAVGYYCILVLSKHTMITIVNQRIIDKLYGKKRKK